MSGAASDPPGSTAPCRGGEPAPASANSSGLTEVQGSQPSHSTARTSRIALAIDSLPGVRRHDNGLPGWPRSAGCRSLADGQPVVAGQRGGGDLGDREAGVDPRRWPPGTAVTATCACPSSARCAVPTARDLAARPGCRRPSLPPGGSAGSHVASAIPAGCSWKTALASDFSTRGLANLGQGRRAHHLRLATHE